MAPKQFLWQPLGIPFEAVGASDPCKCFRSVVSANYGPQHFHEFIEDQLRETPCLLHPDSESCKLPECDICVCGTPCPPFSKFRAKRFSDGSVAAHQATDVTMRNARDLLASGLHKAFILEQVPGFDQAEESSDKYGVTPMRRSSLPCLIAWFVEAHG